LSDDTCGEGEGLVACDVDGSGHPDPLRDAGWYYDLPGGEKMVDDMLLRDGKVISLGYTPNQSPCGSGGASVVMEADACSGGRSDTPQFDINDDGVIDDNDRINIGTDADPVWVAPTGMQSAGRLHPPAILMVNKQKEKKYFSSSRGRIIEMTEKATKVGLIYWLEIE
jgi:type IV pilus assembly protein PilY1